MTKFDPELHDDNPPMTEEFVVGMKPSRRGRAEAGTAQLVNEPRRGAIKFDPEIHEENPPLTEDDFAKMRPSLRATL